MLRKEAEEELLTVKERLKPFLEYQAPTVPEVEKPEGDLDDQEVEDKIADKVMNKIHVREVKAAQDLKERDYKREIATIDSVLSDYAKKYDIPKDVMDSAKAEGDRLAPIDHYIGDATRRCEIVLMKLAPHSIKTATDKHVAEVKLEDEAKTKQLDKIGQPGGAAILPVVGKELTASQKEEREIAPFDDED